MTWLSARNRLTIGGCTLSQLLLTVALREESNLFIHTIPIYQNIRKPTKVDPPTTCQFNVTFVFILWLIRKFAIMWPEIEKALKEKRHELKLLPDNVNKEDIDESLFLCEELNLLQISESKLENVPEKIGRLSNLQNLLLYRNKIHSFPVGIPELAKLKVISSSTRKSTSH